ncbi:hypothetical protein LPJ53_005106 [Coemansia erecta]|uniref:DUF3074 domain-containing protein n=1 Tax=Coemansia erecta TaxID=147472 RepID=A0A9W7XWB7_9FUNG|nr:hypothetical protein LPJ53_005106 [Coemansia erecta]
MVLTPIRRGVVPSPLTDARGFDDFATQYLNKCDDLLSYTRRYPVTKRTEHTTVQRQNRNPHEAHRWLRRDTALGFAGATYDDVRHVLFAQRSEHLARWMPQMLEAECVESIVPNLCGVYRYAFRAQGMKAKRDYCQLVVMRELMGERARPRPRVFTPSASMANLAALTVRSQSSTNLAVHTAGLRTGDFAAASLPASPMSPVGSPVPPALHKGMRAARSVMNLHDAATHSPPPPMPVPVPAAPSSYVGLSPQDSFRRANTQAPARRGQKNIDNDNDNDNDNDDNDNDSVLSDAERVPVRRFQIVSVPVSHPNCTAQRGFVRAVYETYEEVREFSDGSVEWTCIHHSDFSGWVPAFMADHSIASAFPREADALVEYLLRGRR